MGETHSGTDAQRASDRSLRMLGEAAGSVAHDFNNALTAIIARAALIKVQSGGGELADHAEAILVAARAASEVVERVRVILNPGSSREFVQVEPVAVVQQATEIVRGRAALAGVRLEARPVLSPPVGGIPGELLHLVVNLATNAIDATGRGGTVIIGCAPDGDRVRFAVRDDGPGIAPEVAAHAFDPFVSTKGMGGIGLGLTVCRRIAEGHHGELRLEQAPGGGTLAVALIPAATDTVRRPRRPTSLELDAITSSVSVMVVDDDRSTLDALEVLLRAAGFVTYAACTVAEGIEVFSREAPAVVVTDLGLDDGDGWELVRLVREADARVPIVVLTGEAAHTATRRRAGVDAVLRKPVNPASLVDLCRELAQSRRRYSEDLRTEDEHG